jgi:DNA-binding XRE family transcriptional regulator
VTTSSVVNWEVNAAEPEIRYLPAIIEFLGYNPLPEATGWGERLLRHRSGLGLSQKDAAVQIGVDPGTLARWERGEREPAGGFLTLVEAFLDGAADSERGVA